MSRHPLWAYEFQFVMFTTRMWRSIVGWLVGDKPIRRTITWIIYFRWGGNHTVTCSLAVGEEDTKTRKKLMVVLMVARKKDSHLLFLSDFLGGSRQPRPVEHKKEKDIGKGGGND